MEKIWEKVFTYELVTEPQKHNVMLTEASMNPKENRQKMAYLMFETFKVPGLYFANPAVLSIYSAGKFIGIVVDSGDGVTQSVPIFDGYSLNHALIKLDFGGRDLTEFMMKLLNETGQNFLTTAEKEIVKAIKERTCYVALEFEEELKSVEPYNYELPDGSHVIVKYQRIRCPEALFKPSMVYKEFNGIAQN